MAATWPSMTGRFDFGVGAGAAVEPPPGPSAGIAAVSEGPLAGLPDGARRVLAGIRARGGGATAACAAADAGLSVDYTRRCLRRLEERRLVERHDDSPVMWGYRARLVRLWGDRSRGPHPPQPVLRPRLHDRRAVRRPGTL